MWHSSSVVARISPPEQRVVAGVHRVLHRVRQDQQQDQIERRVLRGLALAGQAQEDQQEQVDHNSAENELPPRYR
jgi:hypothetical protein